MKSNANLSVLFMENETLKELASRPIVEETIALDDVVKTMKVFGPADLWQVHRLRRPRISRRKFVL